MTDDACSTCQEPPSGGPSPRPPAGRPRIARGASPWLSTVATTAITATLATRSSRRWWLLAAPTAALSAGMLWFFRDPQRGPARGRVIAGADGVVQSIEAQPDGRTRVATFMSPLNVHVNRAPVAGVVTSVVRRPGGYRPAFDKDSERNERVVWHFDTEIGDVEVVQIAGALARRIVPYVEAGYTATQGERIGLIRLGSRVDVYLPAGIDAGVEVGQRTFAGWTRLDRD